jgi:hypothetical protein
MNGKAHSRSDSKNFYRCIRRADSNYVPRELRRVIFFS